MLKFNSLLLTVTLSFFSLILFKTEDYISFRKNTPAHHIKIDQSINAYAISFNNSYEELLSFDKQKRLTNSNFIYSIKPLSKAFINHDSDYLKASNLLDLNLTPTTIIYPFHSFL